MISVVVTNFDGAGTLPACLGALAEAKGDIAEVILADDGSTDDSVAVARRHWPGIRVVALPHSGRPNVARNAGLAAARSRLVMLIDNDVSLDPGCLRRLAEVFSSRPRAAICTPRLYDGDDRKTVCLGGQRLHYLAQSIFLHRGTAPAEPPAVREGVWSGGNMMVHRRRVFEAGGFDEDYLFGWGEDSALYHKITLKGYACYHVEDAVGFHKEKPRVTERAHAQVRNRWFLILETYAWPSLFLLAPAFLVYEIIVFAGLCAKRAPGIYFRANAEVFRHLPRIARKRRATQRGRKQPDGAILTSGPMYLAPALLNRPVLEKGWAAVNRGFDVYWRMVRRFV